MDPELLEPDPSLGFPNKREELRAANSAAFRSADDPEAQMFLRSLIQGERDTPLSDTDKRELAAILSRLFRKDLTE